MVKKFLLVLLAIVALGALYYVGSSFFEKDKVVKSPAPEKPTKSAWDGRADKIINTDITLKRNVFKIYRTNFSGLNYPVATVALVLTARPVAGRVPGWMRSPFSFRGQVPGGASFKPQVKTQIFRGIAVSRIYFFQVPTQSLGSTCRVELDSARQFMVSFPTISPPRRIFSTKLSAPAPPPGNCLAEDGPDQIPQSAKIQRIRVTPQGRSSIVALSGIATIPGNRGVIYVGRRPVARVLVQSNRTWRVRFRIARPKGPVFVRIGTKERPNLAVRKTVLVKP